MARTKTYSRAAPSRSLNAIPPQQDDTFTPWKQTEPSVAQYTTKIGTGKKMHVIVAFTVKFALEGVSKIKYGAVVTRFVNKLPASPNHLKASALARLENDPVTCRFSVPVPFSENAVGAYVRNRIYRKGVSGEYARLKRAKAVAAAEQLIQLVAATN